MRPIDKFITNKKLEYLIFHDQPLDGTACHVCLQESNIVYVGLGCANGDQSPSGDDVIFLACPKCSAGFDCDDITNELVASCSAGLAAHYKKFGTI